MRLSNVIFRRFDSELCALDVSYTISTMSQQVSSLFVGRWQPFHEGHQKLIETVLKKGKPVTIAIRDTEISHKNPYTTTERWTMIQKALQAYGELVKIIVIPDIDEICYGRDVGYDIRHIELDTATHAISGTKTRLLHAPSHNIIWFTGQSGAGKTTLATMLREKIGGIILDGDEMRESISVGAGFGQKDRHEHNMRVARLAMSLSKQTNVIVSVIAPFAETRNEIEVLIKPTWVYVRRAQNLEASKYPYEVPSNPDIVADVDAATPEENVEKVVMYLRRD